MVRRNYYRGPMEEGDSVNFTGGPSGASASITWTFPGNRPAYVTFRGKGALGTGGGVGAGGVGLSDSQPSSPGVDGQPGTAGDGGSGGAKGTANDGQRGPGGGGGGGGGAAGASFAVMLAPEGTNVSDFTGSTNGQRFYLTGSPIAFGAYAQEVGGNSENFPVLAISAPSSPNDNYPSGEYNNFYIGHPGQSGSKGEDDGRNGGGFGGRGGDGRLTTQSDFGQPGDNGQPGSHKPCADGNSNDGQPGGAGQAGSDGTTPQGEDFRGASGQAGSANPAVTGQPGTKGGDLTVTSIDGPSYSYTFLGGAGGPGGVGQPASVADAPLGGLPGLNGTGQPGADGTPGNPGQAGLGGGAGTGGVAGQFGTGGSLAAGHFNNPGYSFTSTTQPVPTQGYYPNAYNRFIDETFRNNASSWLANSTGNYIPPGTRQAAAGMRLSNNGRMGIGGFSSYWNATGNASQTGHRDHLFRAPRGSRAYSENNEETFGHTVRTGQPGGYDDVRFDGPGGDSVIRSVHGLGQPGGVGFRAVIDDNNPYYPHGQDVAYPGTSVGAVASEHEVLVSVRKPLAAQFNTGANVRVRGGLGGGGIGQDANTGGRGGDGGDGGLLTPVPLQPYVNKLTGQPGGAGGGGSSGLLGSLADNGNDGQPGGSGQASSGETAQAGTPGSVASPGANVPGDPGQAATADSTTFYVKPKQSFQIEIPYDEAAESFVNISWSPH